MQKGLLIKRAHKDGTCTSLCIATLHNSLETVCPILINGTVLPIIAICFLAVDDAFFMMAMGTKQLINYIPSRLYELVWAKGSVSNCK